MQISPNAAIHPITPIDRTITSAQTQSQNRVSETTFGSKAVDDGASKPKVFEPAPPLRPNVQDYIDINRTLLALRQAGASGRELI